MGNKMVMLENYQRILILGCPGAGKTTLAKSLAEVLGLPLYQMDSLYWLPGWQRPDDDAFLLKLQAVARQPQWIIEGNYFRYLEARLEHADAIILLRVSTTVCLWRCWLRFLKRSYAKLLNGENIFTAFRIAVAYRLFVNIWTFNRKTLPKMHVLLQKKNLPVFEMKNMDEVTSYAS